MSATKGGLFSWFKRGSAPENAAPVGRTVSYPGVSEEINRLITSGGCEALRSAVAKEYQVLTANDMAVAKGNVHKLVYLAEAIRNISETHDGLRWEMSRLCHSIENISGELYRDASDRYNKLREAEAGIEPAKAEVHAMHAALVLLSYPLKIKGAQNKFSASNYSYWRDYVRNCELAIAEGRYYKR